MTTDDSEPYVNSRSASLIEGDGATYVLVGTIIETVDPACQKSHHLLIGDGLTRPIDERMVPLFKWFNTPRSDVQVNDWLTWAGTPADFLNVLLRGGLLVKVNSSGAWKAAKSLRGFRLAPTSFPDPEISVPDGLIAVKYSTESLEHSAMTTELADVLWGAPSPKDVPTAIAALAKRLGVSREDAARYVLTDVPIMLDYGYIRLEPLRG